MSFQNKWLIFVVDFLYGSQKVAPNDHPLVIVAWSVMQLRLVACLGLICPRLTRQVSFDLNSELAFGRMGSPVLVVC